MRTLRTPIATLGALALALGLLGALCGCAEPDGLKVEGPAPSPSPGTGTVYVSEGAGRPPLRSPATFTASGTVRLTGLRWSSWGGSTAEGTGKVGGAWCAPGCATVPYDARVTLGGLVRQDRSAYYSRATVDVEGLPSEQRAELRDLRLHIPKR
ncbi:hypothetical protein [Streptomyces sp. NPDC051173]|uniref:hypothetical protein n=1 Tax=Streptomyces sp. NPDC051173 TaxID=3155164 RepID=UPI00344B16F6